MHQNQTLIKSMEVLRLFEQYESLTLTEIVEMLGQPKTTVYRMVSSLQSMGWISRRKDSRYELGLLFVHYGQLVLGRLNIRDLVLPVMRQLSHQLGETVNLIVREGLEGVYIEKVEAVHPVRIYHQRPGDRVPLYAGACPRVLLSFLPDEEVAEYLRHVKLRPFASGTITKIQDLQMTIIESRRVGYTISHAELVDDTSAVAAPIFNHLGEVVAGLSIAGLTSHFSDERLPNLTMSVRQAAKECSCLLGYPERESQLERLNG
ncbi:IclR family transcriptional regulator [Alicyclobacillus sp. TC]|uniref:IclR family transcriptional regulator n=1 Tax=Alicyclobacillus sp. TC TaxID=2606450 RepID=UPI001EE48FE9|nr:IclR family transcriptional regulator [Alicyclobacillus sp. TC]